MDRIDEISKEIKDDEKLLIAKIDDKYKLSKDRNRFISTDFLDLSQQEKVKKYLTNKKISDFQLFGGYDIAERKLLILLPKENEFLYDENNSLFKVYNQIMCIIRIKLPKELWGTFEHKNYLGGLMKLGIKREKIGDICVRSDGADIIISTDIKDFLLNSLIDLTRFQKSIITIEKIDNLIYEENEKKVLKINVPSMRLDAIVGELAKVSRSDSTRLLEQERVFVNFEQEIRGSKIIKEDTIITIRGKGRYKIVKIIGTTRKGRISVEVEK